ncbi:hypothetical protein [Hyalangium rubrum]|uniref:Uncharacterized protein n=1 Tax=Hyalangium rubrum TaxID=3103134 RepID=A0ABU5GYG3_9BACT|nr:hypothetical protein [Hyalangium sp. s54d21]MDY7226235.1 hypothetical protein [Hyalangium sp. s54d21]
MNLMSHRLCVGLALLGLAGTASAQTAPPNIHFLVDTSGSMRELPQVVASDHIEFFNNTTNGCFNPRLDAAQESRGWHPDTVYAVPDVGTGLGTDTGFPNLFQDSKFYGYMAWLDSSNPTPYWSSKEQACQSQVPDWNTTRTNDYNRCMSCLDLKGYYKVPEAEAVNNGDLSNPNFIFSGRFLNFNPPKYVTMRAVLKKVIKNLQQTRVGYSYFSNSAPNTVMGRGQNATCDAARADPYAFDSHRINYVQDLNALTYNTSTPLARSLLNIGYYFTSDNGVYRDVFGFGTGYTYPLGFQNPLLTSSSRSVCWQCQHSAVVIITDGEPTSDSLNATVVTKLRTLNGGPVYCPDTEWCGYNSSSGRDKGTSSTSYTDDNPNYYLDDVARLLSQQDLQRNTPSVVGEFDTAGLQRVTVHTVGFGIQSNLLKNTAAVGGGLYYSADSAATLQLALQGILSNVQTQAATCTLPTP